MYVCMYWCMVSVACARPDLVVLLECFVVCVCVCSEPVLGNVALS